MELQWGVNLVDLIILVNNPGVLGEIMIVIEERHKWVYFDVDETLINWYPKESEIIIDGYPMGINTDVINYLKQCHRKGCTVCVWSQGGSSWAKEVVEALNLQQYVDVCLSKPHEHVDDLIQTIWMGEWNHVQNGKLKKVNFNE